MKLPKLLRWTLAGLALTNLIDNAPLHAQSYDDLDKLPTSGTLSYFGNWGGSHWGHGARVEKRHKRLGGSFSFGKRYDSQGTEEINDFFGRLELTYTPWISFKQLTPEPDLILGVDIPRWNWKQLSLFTGFERRAEFVGNGGNISPVNRPYGGIRVGFLDENSDDSLPFALFLTLSYTHKDKVALGIDVPVY